jgi:bifunctional non-homologous end joining protein LigD
MSTAIKEVTLYKTEGSADKVYGLVIEEAPGAAGLYHLYYMNGRRGSSLRKNLKLAAPVSLDAATAEFNKVESAKMKDGYTPAQSGQSYTSTPDAGRVSGVRPMLPADLPKGRQAETLSDLLRSDEFGVQEKIYGENRGLVISQDEVKGINKNGLVTSIPVSWADELSALPKPAVIFGEQVGDVLHAFDMIELGGKNFRNQPLEVRYKALESALKSLNAPSIKLVPLIKGSVLKRQHMRDIDAAKGEGIVLKRLDAVFEPGKNSNTYRHKFREGMTCFVTACNVQRSVAVGATDPATGAMVALGNVTIPSNHAIPKVGDLVEVEYLYRHENGGLMEPTYEGPRTDVLPETVTLAQITRIKFKGQPLDTSDVTLSQQALAELARTELQANIETITPFVPVGQLATLKELVKGGEGNFYAEKIQEMAQTVRTMPQTGETREQGEKAVVQLRYFWGDYCEALITEKDKGNAGEADPGQHQAFGSVDTGVGHELGFVSIAEIIQTPVELDLYFEPKSLEVIFERHTQTLRSQEATYSP